MLSLTIENNNLKISNFNSSILFSISDNKVFSLLKKYLDSFPNKVCDKFEIEKINIDKSILKLGNDINVIIDNLTTYEISTRMILLNKDLKYPEVNFSD